MPDAPELLSQTSTPQVILDRFELLRDRYRMGLIDAGSFNELLKIFQFRDAGGVLWTPGAKSREWYRWTGRDWTPGNPPDQLVIPAMALDSLAGSGMQSEPLAPHGPGGPRAVTCAKCGASNVGKKFCTSCGTRLAPT